MKDSMTINRIWDYFSDRVCHGTREVVNQLLEKSGHHPLYFSIQKFSSPQANKDALVVSFLGKMESCELQDPSMKTVLEQIKNNHCIIDLNFCTFVDSSGFGFLLKLRKALGEQGNSSVLCNLSASVHQAFRIVKLDKIFQILPDLPAAKKLLLENSE